MITIRASFMRGLMAAKYQSVRGTGHHNCFGFAHVAAYGYPSTSFGMIDSRLEGKCCEPESEGARGVGYSEAESQTTTNAQDDHSRFEMSPFEQCQSVPPQLIRPSNRVRNTSGKASSRTISIPASSIREHALEPSEVRVVCPFRALRLRSVNYP